MLLHPVPASENEVAIEIKKSRFIARASRVDDRQQAKECLQRMRDDYPDARHHCWAYLLGDATASCDAAMNDDGEPSGTAGKPILNVLRHKGVGNIMVVVARYFGGIKLGAGGLTRAYSSAAEAVMSTLAVVQHEPVLEERLRCEFSQEQLVRHWAAVHGATISEPVYSQNVTLTLRLSERDGPALTDFCRSNGVVIESEDRC